MSRQAYASFVTVVSKAALGLALTAWPTSSQAGVETWADANLPVKDGLRAWLDAGRRAPGAEAPANAPLAVWPDGSGERRDFVQADAKARPKLVQASGRSFVRFDGIDDFLEAKGIPGDVRAATVFIVAAPASNLGCSAGSWRARRAARTTIRRA